LRETFRSAISSTRESIATMGGPVNSILSNLLRVDCVHDVMKFASLVLILSAALRAQNANPLSADVERAYSEIKNNILRSAEKMPEENYDFRPAPRVRTFGQILGHIAQEQYLYFCAPIKGEQKSVDIERTKTAKSDLIAALKDSFSYCDAVYGKMTDAEATQIVNTGGSQSTKLRLLWMNIVHDESHYGNLVTYLRMKGIVPPSTEGQ
jgi:uncharacterized damage-inducible protein DinB